MAFKCFICKKGPRAGHSITHSHKAVKRRFKPNLQRIRILFQGAKKKVYVCTSCIRSGKIVKAI